MYVPKIIAHPIMGRYLIALLAIIVISVALFLIGLPNTAILFSMAAIPFVVSWFATYALIGYLRRKKKAH